MKQIIYDIRQCTGCGACSQICPKGAVTMEADEEGFLFPKIDQQRCNDCGICRRTCPVNIAFENIRSIAVDEDGSAKFVTGEASVVPPLDGKRAFACYSEDDDTREKSSSGGIFTELARRTLEDGGVVFGAAFDGEFNVKHRYIESIGDLDDLRRSKYVQSETGKAFREAEKHLKNGRKVLFCGTPCQIAGLKAFLGKEYADLTACDLACFGVPSPKVWRMYLDYMKDRHDSAISSISFRDKSGGWRVPRMNIIFSNGSRYLVKLNNEIYAMGYFKNLFTRKSCFDCRFKLHNSHADLTLADFWGVEKLGRQAVGDDDRGISLVIIHSEAGENALAALSDRAETVEYALEDAIRYNPRLTSSLPEPAARARFFADMKKGFDFDRLRRKYMDNTSIKYRLKCIIKKMLGRA